MKSIRIIADCDLPANFKKTRLYRVFAAEREEILKHKWLESEKAGKDIGFEPALVDWIIKHRANWRRAYMAKTEFNDMIVTHSSHHRQLSSCPYVAN